MDLWTVFFFFLGGGEILSIQLISFNWFMLIWNMLLHIMLHHVNHEQHRYIQSKCIWHCLIFLEKIVAQFSRCFYPAHNSRGFRQTCHAFLKNRSPQCQCSCDACCCRCCWIKMVQVTGVLQISKIITDLWRGPFKHIQNLDYIVTWVKKTCHLGIVVCLQQPMTLWLWKLLLKLT